jgi:hypothetical protein
VSETSDTTLDAPASREPGAADAWRSLRRQAERRRYLTILTPRRVGKEKPRRPNPAVGVPRDSHHLLRPPAELTRTATNFPDPEHVRQYLRHSCDVTMTGGITAALVHPLGVAALAEHYVLRRVGGSSVAAVAAAAAAAAELGRGAPDLPGDDPNGVSPGFAGLAETVGWLAGQDVARQDPASLASGGSPLDEGPEQWRLARLLQPAVPVRPLFRLFTAVQRARAADPGARSDARRRVALTVLAGFTRRSRVASGIAWTGALAAWLLLTVAIARGGVAVPAVVLASLMLLVSAVLAASALSVLASVLAVRDLVRGAAPVAGFGLVPGVAVEWTGRRKRRRRMSQRLDALAGVPTADGVPALASWLTDRLDDLAGIPRGRIETSDLFDSAGLLSGGGLPGGGEGDPDRKALTFGDLWLGRAGDRGPDDEDLLRRAATDPEHRVVDLLLTTTNLTQRRPYRMPLPVADELERRGLSRFLFCRTCLEGVLPLRVVVQLVKASPALDTDHACPRHEGALLHELPDPWDVPVALATRMSMAVPGLLTAVPLCTVDSATDAETPGTVRLHWFGDGDLTAGMPVGAFDTLLPRWPTFALHVGADGVDGVAADGVDLPEQDASRRPLRWREVTSVSGFLRLAADAARVWSVTSVADLPGYRGRVAHVAADGPAPVPYLPQRQILALAARGAAAGEALRTRFTASDDGITGQTQTDRYRWIRLRTALREYRGLSLSIGARLPLYSDLAAGYRVPAALADWFPEGFEAGSKDPSWPEAAATVTHLRALSAGGVLDWDADLGAPPVDPELRLQPPI